MKVRNLMDYPQQLGDRKMIGATGTAEEQRDYALDKLTKEDQQLVKREMLEVVKEPVAEAVTTTTTTTTAPVSEAEKPKGGTSNAK